MLRGLWQLVGSRVLLLQVLLLGLGVAQGLAAGQGVQQLEQLQQRVASVSRCLGRSWVLAVAVAAAALDCRWVYAAVWGQVLLVMVGPWCVLQWHCLVASGPVLCSMVLG